MRRKIFMMLCLLPIANFLAAFGTANGVFIENRGQYPEEIRYILTLPESTVFFKDNTLVQDFFSVEQPDTGSPDSRPLRVGRAVTTHFLDSQTSKYRAGKKSITKFNYFIGKNPESHVSGVPAYESITIEGLYKGIDARFLVEEGRLRYDFIVEPGADIAQIKIKFSGNEADPIITDDNTLIFENPEGQIEHAGVKAFQGDKTVECLFTDAGSGTVGFEIENYDSEEQLIIDPKIYSTYFGGNADENLPVSVTATKSGNPVLAGNTDSRSLPTSDGAYKSAGSKNIFLAEFSADGTELLYCTFFGGRERDYERVDDIITDNKGNIIICGSSDAESGSFPTTETAYQEDPIGNKDVFVSIFSDDLSKMKASSFFGGMLEEIDCAVAVDSAGMIYIGGRTTSKQLPRTADAVQKKPGETPHDGFLAVFTPDLTDVIAATYLGGNHKEDIIADIEITPEGDVTVTGQTKSSDITVTNDAYQKNNEKDSPAGIIAVYSPDLSNLKYCSYFGDHGNGVFIRSHEVIDEGVIAFSVAYLAMTPSHSYPVTEGALMDTPPVGVSSGALTEFDYFENKVLRSTFWGSEEHFIRFPKNNLAIDRDGNFVFSYSTKATDIPVSEYPFQKSNAGGQDALITKISPDMSEIVYSSYFGGTGDDYLSGMCLINDKNFLFAGLSFGDDYPTSGDAYSRLISGGREIFMTMETDQCLMLDNAPKIMLADKAAVGNKDRLEFFAFFRNSNKQHVTLDNAYFEGPDSEHFEIISPQFPITVPPLETVSLEFFCTPDEAKRYEVKMKLEYECGIDSTTLAVNSFCPLFVPLPNIEPAEAVAYIPEEITVEDCFLCRNGDPGRDNYQDSILIEDIYFESGAYFTLLSPLPGSFVPSDTPVDLKYVFSPQDAGNYIDNLIIKTPCFEEKHRFRGIGSDYPTPEFNLMTENIASPAGRIVNVITYLEISEPLERETTINYDLTFDAELLFPIENRDAPVEAGRRRVSCTPFVIAVGYTNDKIAIDTVRCTAMLGSSISTPIEFENVRTNLPADVNDLPGSFSLSDVCEEGGIRLVENTEAPEEIRSIRPNPAENEAEIEYTVNANSGVTVEIISSSGNILRRFNRPTLDAGTYTQVCNLSDFPSGMYIVKLTVCSPGGINENVRRKTFIIEK